MTRRTEASPWHDLSVKNVNVQARSACHLTPSVFSIVTILCEVGMGEKR